MLREPQEQGGADSAPTGIRMHARRDEAPPDDVRAPGYPRTDDLAVELRDEHEPLGLGAVAKLLRRPGGLVRQDGPLDAAPGFEVRVRVGLTNADHPDLLSFPCCFA